MTKYLLLLLLTHQILAQTNRPQNLCRDASEKGSIFAPDPSDCRLYLFCTGEGVTIVQNCENTDPNYPFFNFERCIDSNSHCTPSILMCPPEGQNDVMIAVSGDVTCKKYRPCRLPGFPPFECAGDFLFDRNTGTCASPDKAPCFYDNQPPPFSCAGKDNGKYANPGSCTEYIYCYDGEVLGFFECTPGTHFDETTQTCIPEEESSCGEELTTLTNEIINFIWEGHLGENE